LGCEGLTEKNQDSAAGGENAVARFIAVADGVGTARHSHLASRALTNGFTDTICSSVEHTYPDGMEATEVIALLERFYYEAPGRVEAVLKASGVDGQPAASTFIAVLELESCCALTYLADGSAYLVNHSADGTSMRASSLLMTTAPKDQDVPPPQVNARQRSEAPYTLIVPNQRPEGVMWIIASDGMNDFEHYGSDGAMLHGADAAELMAQEIWQRFMSDPAGFTDQAVIQILLKWVKRCQTTDDATVAVLISARLFHHWNQLVVAGR
jgi:hypothetical protein